MHHSSAKCETEHARCKKYRKHPLLATLLETPSRTPNSKAINKGQPTTRHEWITSRNEHSYSGEQFIAPSCIRCTAHCLMQELKTAGCSPTLKDPANAGEILPPAMTGHGYIMNQVWAGITQEQSRIFLPQEAKSNVYNISSSCQPLSTRIVNVCGTPPITLLLASGSVLNTPCGSTSLTKC